MDFSKFFYFLCHVFLSSEATKTNTNRYFNYNIISRRDVVFRTPTYSGIKADRMCNGYTTQACNGVLIRRQRQVMENNDMSSLSSISIEPNYVSEPHVSNSRERSSKLGNNHRLSKLDTSNDGGLTLLENSNAGKEIRESNIGVVGGRLARPKEYPHMALLGFGRYSAIRWSCGGSLISENFILSAAHCVSSNQGNPTWVRLGELNLATTTDDARTTDFPIIQVIVHPDYKPPIQYNDIALFRFQGVYTFSNYIRPICLNIYQNLANQKVTVVGWGSTGYGEMGSDHLLSVELNLQRDEKCDLLYRGSRLPNGFNASTQICVGYPPGGKDSCQGDSGGPLQIVNYHAGCTTVPIYKQVGIVSFGENCALPDTPAVYTRVSFFIPWIESIVWN